MFSGSARGLGRLFDGPYFGSDTSYMGCSGLVKSYPTRAGGQSLRVRLHTSKAVTRAALGGARAGHRRRPLNCKAHPRQHLLTFERDRVFGSGGVVGGRPPPRARML